MLPDSEERIVTTDTTLKLRGHHYKAAFSAVADFHLTEKLSVKMSPITTHPADTIFKNKNGEKRGNIEPVECDTPISERETKKKKRKEAKLKLNEHQQESQPREEGSCSLNDTPNKRQKKGAKEGNEGAGKQDLNDDNVCKQPQGCTNPKDCLVCQRKRKVKKKKCETNQEVPDVNMEPVEGDKPQSQTSDGVSAPPASLKLDTPVLEKRKDEKRKEKKKNTETGSALNSDNLQQSECEELTLDTPPIIKKRKKDKMYEDGKKKTENKDDQAVAEERSTDLSSSQINVEGSAPNPNLMFDTPQKKKRKKDKIHEDAKKNTDDQAVAEERSTDLSSYQINIEGSPNPNLTFDTPQKKKRKKDKIHEDGKKNTENKDDQAVAEERSTDLSSSQINVEGSAPNPNLTFDTPRKKKRKKDKGKLNDENTEPVEGNKPQAQISDGGSTPLVGIMLVTPTSKKKDNKLKEKQQNTETGNALNTEHLQQSECGEPSLTLDTPPIKKRKKDKRSEDSEKNKEKKDNKDVAEERSTDLSSPNVGVTSDTPSQKRKDKKVKKKELESNQNLNEENLEHLSSQTRDVSPPPVTTAMLHSPTQKKKKKKKREAKNQELNDDLESTGREAPPGETSDVTLLKKKSDKTSKKNKTKTDETSKEKKSISWSDLFSVHEFPLAKQTGPRKRWMVCEGFQFILKHQAEALLKLGVNPYFKDVLCQLWRMYLQSSRQAYTNNPIRHSHLKRVMRSQSNDATMDSSFQSSDEDRRTDMFSDTGETSGEETEESDCESVISGSFDVAKYLTPSMKRGGSLLSMRKTLALCYLALVWCREGITLSELLRFVSEGHIPYVNAHDLFPEDMKPTGRDTLLFRASSIPLYKDVHKEAQTLAIYLALPRFPPISSQCLLHPAVLSLRYLAHINLPDQLYEWVCWVMEKAGLSEESINTLDPMNAPLPRYDLQTAAAIIVTMKLLFGFNDHTEWVVSNKAGDKDKQHPEQNTFNLRRWYRLLQTALTRATHARNRFTARKQWTHKKALLRGKSDSIVLKHRRVVEQLQASFENVSGRPTGPQPSSPSTFIFRWGGEEDEDRSDGPSLHEQSLNCVSALRKGVRTLLNTNYWHADIRDCKKRLSCKSHYKELEASGLPRSYVWLLELFSFLLEVRAATLHEEVKTVERKLFKHRIKTKRSLRHRRWRHWWRTRGQQIKV